MKRILLWLLAFPYFSFAQDTDRKTIAVVPFTASGSTNARMYAGSVTEIVVSAVVKLNRFTVVDRTHFDAIFNEENLQKGESFIEGLVVEQGKKLGAQYIISGNLTSVGVTEHYSNVVDRTYTDKSTNKVVTTTRRERDGYTAQISFTFKFIDVETGKILGTAIIDNRSGGLWGLGVYGSPDEAIANAIKGSLDEVMQAIDKQFPVVMRIFEITESSRKRAKSVVVTAGSDKGLQPKQELKVFEITFVEIDGKTVERRRPIGILKIKSVDDENFSTCVVKDGGEFIKKAFESKQQLIVMSGN
ncbi:MAG: CsgG/HfaB family protein [Cytophagales bacterium]|nr:CsgG/HfaB family protein [Cytophagales bacterium]MDW8383401.1 CsgG/HfaB family protein [Flammeovirgaceae bacterium]